MKLIAQKPCSFGGKQFYIGDEIPSEYVLNPTAMVNYGVIAIIEENDSGADSGNGSESGSECKTFNNIIIPDVTMSILVRTENGVETLEPTDEGIQDIFTVLIGKATEAEAVINQMDDADALILLHMADARKSVKAAAEARAKALSQESEGEQ